jgi:bacterioferritin (cytochrome b1)
VLVQLVAKKYEESTDEMKHADHLIERKLMTVGRCGVNKENGSVLL